MTILFLLSRRVRAICGKTTLILLLIISLLGVMQAGLGSIPVEAKERIGCVTMKCGLGCCANGACCGAAKRQTHRAPVAPPQGQDLQLAAIGLRHCVIVFLPRLPVHSIVIRDELSASHALRPLAVSCIRLI